jgi:plasmid stabilization system protein ParE
VSYLVVNNTRVYIDILEALEYYYPISPKLASDFLDRIEEAKTKASTTPKAFQIKHSSKIRTVLLDQFPYHLYFLIENKNTIIILAIIHAESGHNKVKKIGVSN